MQTCAIAVVLALGLQQPPAPATPPAASPQGDLKLVVAADRPDYVVGDDVQAEVTLSNGSAKDQEVAELCFDERSLSFEIVFGDAKKKFDLSIVRPDPHLAERLALPRVALKPGKSLIGLVRFPVLAQGPLQITGVYRGADKEVRAAAVTVAVKPQADGGNRLAAVVETSQGTFQIDLKPEDAPNNVSNFVSLARRGFYRNMNFHRVVKNEWIQSGCPYDNGYGSVGYALKSEAAAQASLHEAGTVAMSGNMKEGYTGSQFYVCLRKSPGFDKKYPIIGVVSGAGMDVAKKIGAVEVDKTTDRPKEDVRLKDVKIIVLK